MTTFGLERASDASRSHGGSGLNHVFDITALAQRLGLTQRTVSRLRVSFVRQGVTPSVDEMPAGLEAFARAPRRDPSIRVGRVSLFYG